MKIRLQADDFFAAYKVLQKEVCMTEKLFVLTPAIVCLAFALELYIKSLYEVLKIKMPKKHEILELYRGLPQEIRREIFDRCSMCIRGDSLSPRQFSKDYTEFEKFEDQIKMLSKGFVDWRYAHEHSTLQYSLSDAVGLIETISVLVNERIHS